MSPETIAFISLIVAFISVLISIRGNRIARKSLSLSQKQDEDLNREIVGYLIDGIRWNSNKNSYISFAVSYTNTATAKNTFTNFMLEIEFYDEQKKFGKIKLDPKRKEIPNQISEKLSEMELPINIGDRETISGWITFQLPTMTGLNIEQYKILAETANHQIVEIDSILVSKVVER